ncbi:MAG: hypothetical protein JNM26_18970 [Ideonella sp.]|nr:hypothetical protein [Ideonella sp.]
MSLKPEGALLRAVGRHLLAVAILAIAVSGSFTSCALGAEPGVGPTVREVVEFTRILGQRPMDPNSIRVSPDGRRAFIVTRRGDVAGDRNRYEFLLLDLDPQRLAAGRPKPPASLWTLEGITDNDYTRGFVRDADWVNDHTLVFRGRRNEGPYQVYRLDVDTRRLTQLTFEALGIESFALSKDMTRIVYATPVPNPPMRPGARSVVVGSNSFWNIKFGQDDLRGQVRRFQYRAAVVGSRAPAISLGEPVGEVTSTLPPISVSPDGRWAVLPRYEAALQPTWVSRYPLVAETARTSGPAVSEDPLRYYSRAFQWVARRHVAYRLSDGQPQVVLDAPDDAVPRTGPLRTDRLWTKGGRSLILAGTHLPPADAAGPPDLASHVVEYWPETGRWRDIAVLKSRLTDAMPLPGDIDGFVAIDGGQRRRFVRGSDGVWMEHEGGAGTPSSEGGQAVPGGWAVRIDQALDRPPDVVAEGPAGQIVRLTELNPGVSSRTWGSMAPYAWSDAQGRRWQGGLLVPAGHDPGRRYSLVIQTYGFSDRRFYLDGMNLQDGATSGFAGRAFLREGMLVLAFPLRPTGGPAEGLRDELETYYEGIDSAIRSLVAQGLVDRDRIGLMGWSASGERVLNVLTFGRAPIRAASLIDADANSLFAYTVGYGFSDGLWKRMEQRNQGLPFGEHRSAWIRNDPALNTDCIEAAVRIESYGPWVLPQWDIYALLRRQLKPAEMVVIPGGTHALAKPSERMISLQGNVDWYRFWLKGEERAEPVLPNETPADLRAQYERWRQMAELERAGDARPRCSGRPDSH